MSVLLVMDICLGTRGDCSTCHGDAWGVGMSVILITKMPGE